MNVKDSERMEGLLAEVGYCPVDDPAEADVILVNTCSVREKPERKVFDELGRLKALKEKRAGVVIGVAGCVAQQFGAEFLDRFPHLDLVIGTQNVHRLPELIERAQAGERVCAADWLPPGDPALFKVPAAYPRKRVSSFVSIMQGCDNFCAYCIVPSVRGPAMSRQAGAILAEVGRLAESGVREVILLGQNVNAYQDGEGDFADLLPRVGEVPGVLRVRFTTSHPKDFSDRLLAVMAAHPRIMPNLHLPVQAGSDRVLLRMNRNYTRGHYLNLVRKLRAAIPEVGLTTDLIVGFPGETEDDFQETLSLLSAVRYDETFSFRFSPRPGSVAARFPDQVPEKVKYDRLYRLQELQRKITEEKNREQEGKVHEVLIEGPSKTDPERWTGRTRTNRLAHLPMTAGRPGEAVKVRITQALKHSLKGEIIIDNGAAPNCGPEEEPCLWR
jgi:tRNA-2-methylthio-N6-dimethylallyladenosine synthase